MLFEAYQHFQKRLFSDVFCISRGPRTLFEVHRLARVRRPSAALVDDLLCMYTLYHDVAIYRSRVCSQQSKLHIDIPFTGKPQFR